MRLRITRKLSGSIDGLQLAHFEPGTLYDVGTSLGSYLLALGAAEPVNDDAPERILPINESLRKTQTAETPRAVAADRPARRKWERR